MNRIWIHYYYCLKFKECSFIKSNEIILHFMCSNAAERYIHGERKKKNWVRSVWSFNQLPNFAAETFLSFYFSFFLFHLLLLIDNIHLPIINSIENLEEFEFAYARYTNFNCSRCCILSSICIWGLFSNPFALTDSCLEWRNNIRIELNCSINMTSSNFQHILERILWNFQKVNWSASHRQYVISFYEF